MGYLSNLRCIGMPSFILLFIVIALKRKGRDLYHCFSHPAAVLMEARTLTGEAIKIRGTGPSVGRGSYEGSRWKGD